MDIKSLETYVKEASPNELLTYTDEDGNTLLHVALMNHYNSLAESILLKAPELVNVENHNKQSPIYIAHINNNKYGVKLCLEFHPHHGSTNNNCYNIFKQVEGEETYIVRTKMSEYHPSFNNKNMDKLAIILNVPDPSPIFVPYSALDLESDFQSRFGSYFKKEGIPTLIIGNKINSLTFQQIKNEINQISLPEKILIIIDAHGNNDKNGNLMVNIDNTFHDKFIKDLFITFKNIFHNQPIEIILTACYGGAALKEADLLPQSSKLVIFSKPENTVNNEDIDEMISIHADFENFPERFSAEYFLKTYCLNLKESNNIPGIATAGENLKFLDEFTDHLGKPIPQLIKDTVLERLKIGCWKNSQCESNIIRVLEQIEKENNIENFKAPTKLYKTFIENYFGKASGDEINVNKLPCWVNESEINDDYRELINSPETDYSLCHNTRVLGNAQNLCSEIPTPEIPVFGTAMIALYELSNMDNL